jgi:FAD binding domain
MNAGIADAMDLSWMLAGVLQGWAAPAILDAFEAERWPITEQVSHYAMNTAASLARARAEVPASIEASGPEGNAVRERFGRTVYDLNVPQYCCGGRGGLNFGHFYDRSPVIAYDGESAPPYSMYDFTSSTMPGCCLPHVWLHGGRSLYDAMRQGFILLRFDPSMSVAALVGAAAHRGVPFTVLDVAADNAPHNLVRSRSDQHIAWRGKAQHPGCRYRLSSGATLRMNNVRLCATSSYDIGPSRNCIITPPTPIASTCASFSATVAGDP